MHLLYNFIQIAKFVFLTLLSAVEQKLMVTQQCTAKGIIELMDFFRKKYACKNFAEHYFLDDAVCFGQQSVVFVCMRNPPFTPPSPDLTAFVFSEATIISKIECTGLQPIMCYECENGFTL